MRAGPPFRSSQLASRFREAQSHNRESKYFFVPTGWYNVRGCAIDEEGLFAVAVPTSAGSGLPPKRFPNPISDR